MSKARAIATWVLMLLVAITSRGYAETQSNIPPKFQIPWGNGAVAPYIRSIPQPSQIGIQNCAASLTDGFPPLTFVPLSSGGCPPFGQDFNGILKQITQWNRWAGAGEPLLYDSTFSTAIGGYPKGARLTVAASPGCVWLSLVDNNTSNPDTGGANWQNSCNEAVGGVLSGTLPNPGMACCGSWPNVGGSLTGSLPNPGLNSTGVSAGTYYNATVTFGADGRATSASGGTSAGSCLPMAQFGANGNGSADNTSALTNAVAALPATGGCLAFPAGKFAFSTLQTITLPNALYSLRISGAGQDSTILYWPNAAGGLTLNFNNAANSFHLENLTFSTGVTNGGNGFAVVQFNCTGAPGPFASSSASHVTWRGDDNNFSFYWSQAVIINKVSGTNWEDILVYGSAGNLGSGLLFEGASGCASVVHNVSKAVLNSLAVAISYLTWAQGLTVTQTNINNGVIGIQVPSGQSGIAQLAISNSQFNTTGDDIQINSVAGPVLISNNLIYVLSGHAGINLTTSGVNEARIANNQFNSLGSTNNGIVFSGFDMTVTGNSFRDFASGSGIFIESGSANTNVLGNFYEGCTCNVTVGASCVSSGTSPSGNSVGVATP